MSKFSTEQIDAIWRRQQVREEKRREELRNIVANTALPLGDEIVNEIIQLNDRHTREILRSHPGYKLAERRDSYRISLAILEDCISDLLSCIDKFETLALADAPPINSRERKQAERAIAGTIQKELFAAVNSIVSLVDHARRIFKLLPNLDYNAKRVEAFGDDGLHEFIKAFRILVHHLHIISAQSSITYHLSEGKKTATFSLDKRLLLRILDENSDRVGSDYLGAREFILRSTDSVDLRAVFVRYRARAGRFHSWFLNELNSDELVILHDYDRLIRAKVHYDRRLMIRLIRERSRSKRPTPATEVRLPSDE